LAYEVLQSEQLILYTMLECKKEYPFEF